MDGTGRLLRGTVTRTWAGRIARILRDAGLFSAALLGITVFAVLSLDEAGIRHQASLLLLSSPDPLTLRLACLGAAVTICLPQVLLAVLVSSAWHLVAAPLAGRLLAGPTGMTAPPAWADGFRLVDPRGKVSRPVIACMLALSLWWVSGGAASVSSAVLVLCLLGCLAWGAFNLAKQRPGASEATHG